MAVTPQDLKNVDRNKSYADLSKAAKTDVVKEMRAAAKLEMTWSQYCNFISPETLVNEKRSATTKMMQDEGLYTRSSSVSKASLVSEFIEEPFRLALLQSTLYNAYYNKRTQITLEADAPVGSGTYPFEGSQPAPVAGGNRVNPGELVASSTDIGADTYKPFKWDYDINDDDKNLKRHNVAPGATIPPSTLGQSEDNIQLEKWGNRFILPYEVLTGNNLRIDKLAAMIRLEGLTEEVRLFEEMIGILENGDGTTGSATAAGDWSSYGGTDGTFSIGAFMAWLDESFPTPFKATHVLFNNAEFRALRNAVLALTGTNALESLNATGLGPTMGSMEEAGGIRFGRTPNNNISDNNIIAIDARAAIEYVARSGMAIRQQADNIANESREMVISDTYTWAKLAFDAVQRVDIDP